MAIRCPNIHIDEWKSLVSELGEDKAYLSYFRNGSDIPDIETAKKLLSGEISPIKLKEESYGKETDAERQGYGQGQQKELLGKEKVSGAEPTAPETTTKTEEKQVKKEEDAKGTGTKTQERGGKEKVVEGEEERLRVRSTSQDGMEAGKGKEVKQRGTQTGSMTKAGGVFEKIAKEHPLYYDVKGENEQVQDAVSWLQQRDETTIMNQLVKRTGGSLEQRTNRRILFSMYLKENMNKAVDEGRTEDADAIYENLKKIDEALAKENTEIARALQANAKFQRLSDDAVVWTVNREIEKTNQAKFPDTDLKKIKESKPTLDKVAKNIVDDVVSDAKFRETVKKVVEKNKGKKATQTYSEKAKEIADKVRSIKTSNWNMMFADPTGATAVFDGALELTAKTIEASGNIADAIYKGVNKIKRSDWYKGLTEDQKRKVERQYSYNIKKDLGVDKLSDTDLAKYLRKEVKDLGTSINEIVKTHWADENKLAQTLSERLVSDLNLKESEAIEIEKRVLGLVKEGLAKKTDNKMFNEMLPKKEAQKTNFIDKMGQLLMMGKLNDQSFREYFASKFGLEKDLSAEQVAYVQKLNNAVKQTANMGIYGDIVADYFAKELDKMIPQKKLKEIVSGMIGLDYANMLSGATTHYVNIMSALTNELMRPVLNLTDIDKWVRSAQRGEIAELPIAQIFQPYVDFLKMIGKSTSDFQEIVKNGDIRAIHKYISDVQSTAKLQVPELERQKFGKDRFKPIEIAGIDVNAANYAKYVPRLLAAEDAFMNRNFEGVLLSEKLYDKLSKEGVPRKEILKQINRQVFGKELTEKEEQEINDQLAKEQELLNSLGFESDKYQTDRRRFEILREKLLDLPEEELLDVKEAIRGNVFNDDRGGIVNSVMSGISRIASKNQVTKLLIMPFFPFRKVGGNIGDFMIDTFPAYGSLRARGYTPTSIAAHISYYKNQGLTNAEAVRKGIFSPRVSVKELPFKTAMLGDKGSFRHSEQLKRARLGNLMLLTSIGVVAGAYAISGDKKDKDGNPWFDISGGRWDIKDVTKREDQLMPPYTMKIGDFKFRYGNKPILTFGFSMIGNYVDMERAGIDDDTILRRMKMMSDAIKSSFFSVSDQQLMQGFQTITQSAAQIVKSVDETQKLNPEDKDGISLQGSKLMKNLIKTQSTPFTGWLPTKNNFLQQTLQFLDNEAVESKDLDAMLAYNIGIHRWTNKPALDIFGESIYRNPGYTQIYYDPTLIKKDPERWAMTKFLTDNGAMPAPFYNREERYLYSKEKEQPWTKAIIGKTAKEISEKSLPSEDEFYELRKLSGQMFAKDVKKYMDSDVWKKESTITIGEGQTKMQDKIKKYWSEAKQQTRLYLFTWKDFEGQNKKLYDSLYENKALPTPESSIDIYKKDNSGDVYTDENRQIVVNSTEKLTGDLAARFNSQAFNLYMKSMSEMKNLNSENIKILSKAMWESAVAQTTATFNVPKNK